MIVILSEPLPLVDVRHDAFRPAKKSLTEYRRVQGHLPPGCYEFSLAPSMTRLYEYFPGDRYRDAPHALEVKHRRLWMGARLKGTWLGNSVAFVAGHYGTDIHLSWREKLALRVWRWLDRNGFCNQ